MVKWLKASYIKLKNIHEVVGKHIFSLKGNNKGERIILDKTMFMKIKLKYYEWWFS